MSLILTEKESIDLLLTFNHALSARYISSQLHGKLIAWLAEEDEVSASRRSNVELTEAMSIPLSSCRITKSGTLLGLVGASTSTGEAQQKDSRSSSL